MLPQPENNKRGFGPEFLTSENESSENLTLSPGWKPDNLKTKAAMGSQIGS